MTKFYTPGTGLPDFEMRIALGLCAAGLNVVEPKELKLREEFDRYVIEVDSSVNNSSIAKALGWLCQNRLADQSLLLRTPGFRPLHLDKQAKGVADFGRRLSTEDVNLEAVFGDDNLEQRKGAHSCACRHKFDKGDKIVGALLSFSPQLGQPPKRNNLTHQITLPICPYCVVTGLAGTILFQIDVSITTSDRKKKERFFFLPHFRGEIDGNRLLQYLSATKHIRGNLEDIPAASALLSLFSLYPHLIDILDSSISFFVGRVDTSGNAPRYGHQLEQNTQFELAFLKSIYNRAFVQDCYFKKNNRSQLLSLLARSLQNCDGRSALDFVRLYASTTEGKALLPEDTGEFLAKEVLKMDRSLLEGERFGVIKEVADMFQYFVRERNFGYVDNLRKARDTDEFIRLLLDAQREAQSIVLDPKKDNKPYLPGQNTFRTLLQIINEDNNQFKSVQSLIALLAFTYYKKED